MVLEMLSHPNIYAHTYLRDESGEELLLLSIVGNSPNCVKVPPLRSRWHCDQNQSGFTFSLSGLYVTIQLTDPIGKKGSILNFSNKLSNVKIKFWVTRSVVPIVLSHSLQRGIIEEETEQGGKEEEA